MAHLGAKAFEEIGGEVVHFVCSSDFSMIDGKPLAYWLSRNVLHTFRNKPLSRSLTTREGMATADNDRFLRYWHEVLLGKVGFAMKTIQLCLSR